MPAASLSPRTARQATTGLSPSSAWSASASARGAVGVVRGVADHRRVAVDELEAAGQVEALEGARDNVITQGAAQERLRRRDRDRQIPPQIRRLGAKRPNCPPIGGSVGRFALGGGRR